MTKGLPLAERFWSKVDKRGPDECWPWLASRNAGYGYFYGGRNRRSHQVAWELANNAPFPSGLIARHSCDNPGCCNPAHILPGTQADNIHDMDSRGRRGRGGGRGGGKRGPKALQTHCKKGHPLEVSPYPSDRGALRCRTCSRDAARAYYRRKQAALRAQTNRKYGRA